MGGAFPDVKVSYDNDGFTPPSSQHDSAFTSAEDVYKEAWVRLNIMWGAANQVSMGSTPLHRTTGTVIVQIFIPIGRGEGTAYLIADEVADFFRRKRTSGMLFRSPYPRRVGPDEGKWWQLNVVVPFQYDRTED